jgi:D-methionine transport system ATP-binding protein
MIIIKDLSKTYQHRAAAVEALQQINLTINANEIFGVMGKSGSGKSTLLRCMNKLEAPSSGKIFFDSTELTALSAAKLREKRRKIGMIFQSFNLLSSRNTYENIALPLELMKVDRHTVHKKVNHLIELVNLTHHQKHMPSQLSGGQKQRVAIARALITQPQWLLCDEPTSALDPESTLQVLDLLKSIQKELKITIVLITHEMNVIKNTCDRVAVLDQGRLVEQGSVVDIFIRPSTKIAKEFTQHALHLELPSYLKNALKKTPSDQLNPVVQLAFLGNRANEPIIANVLKQFNVTVNILQADLESIQGAAVGFLICKLDGGKESIQQAIQYLNKLNVNVEVIGYV